jgi:uncharacterized protein (DUF2141 family)
MKSHRFSILVPLAAASLGLAAVPQADADPVVKITVAGVKAPQGSIMIALHDEKGWSGAPLARLRVGVAGATVTAVLAAPAPGRYGVKLFHDVNGDGKMDTNIVGFPTEPFGFSNDAPIRLGPPSFADAAFDVGPAGAAQIITLK